MRAWWLAGMVVIALPARAADDIVFISEALPAVEVLSSHADKPLLGGQQAGASELAKLRATTSDSARLLEAVAGVSNYGAGAISSLPSIHGLADDRVRVQVDGMDLVSACPNHMNSPLSYLDASQVASATVYAGITPVSVGGDSIAGTIQVQSEAPAFGSAEAALKKGVAGAFYRSNSQARGGNLGAQLANENWHLGYRMSYADAVNYRAARAFKPAGADGGRWLAGDEVGSTAFDSLNQTLVLAWKQDRHFLQLEAGAQKLGFEGFPNQRMDMTDNRSAQFNLRYRGGFEWGDVSARAFDQYTLHEMNMGADRFSYGSLGMPMNTEAKTTGGQFQANVLLSPQDVLRLGGETQFYTLYDWWPPVGGSMGPNTYWNLDWGRRHRMDGFSEWERVWNPAWTTQAGIRVGRVLSDAAPVQGYNAEPMWADDAARFNGQARARNDLNWDISLLGRYRSFVGAMVEGGYARKSHSPNLYQRYSWSTQPMAALMNNFVGDGNGYVGNLDLRPEVAHTVSLGMSWQDEWAEIYNLKATAYYTHVEDFIDARRCDFGWCGGSANVNASQSFLMMQFVNQSARLFGWDVAGDLTLGEVSDWGRWRGKMLASWVQGDNLTTGDGLYNIMPLNAKWALVQQRGTLSNTLEVQTVAAKNRVSQVRNEMTTAGYALVNLRSSYAWKTVRLDVALENVLDQFYTPPLGGAYLGQGDSMTRGGILWGVPVPGAGRSFYLAISAEY